MSGKTGIIIQARMSSSRLPGKSLMKIGGHPLIWYVVRRAELLDLPVVVCTSTDPTDDPLCNFLEQEEIDFFRGDLHNVLERYINTAEKFGFENIIRVTGDNPLFDYEFLQGNLDLFDRYSYVDGIYENGLIKGAGFEFVKLEELKKIQCPDKEQAEHVTLSLRQSHHENSLFTRLQPRLHDKFRDKIVLTCDYPQDLMLLKEIFSFFHYRTNIRMQEVIRFFCKDPESFKKNTEFLQ
ncbi:cytidylyltransferase domain-containing protein [Salinimicrobium oceani]|uniref:Spore coat polysaccharide biosynthesis protein SpsF n=1 Tax=Salinimicrobium oceani TaxID=2722702 RepID=A0ABX1D1A2_9FLAO|nr:hypothetical protein [Salinimicrobium oceani]NJW53429.1 hypothetical protein [Salinimicrobium oceani]